MNLFSRRFQGQGRVALVALRRARNKASVFLFANFFFAPPISKEKVAMEFVLMDSLFVDETLIVAFPFDTIGTKRKANKREMPNNEGLRPSAPQAFEKA